MALNPKLLDKYKAPAAGGSDPMLDDSDMGGDASDPHAEPDGDESSKTPLGDASDDELMAEAAKRGLKIGPSDEEAAGAAAASMPKGGPAFMG